MTDPDEKTPVSIMQLQFMKMRLEQVFKKSLMFSEERLHIINITTELNDIINEETQTP